MADTKISALPASTTPLAGTEVLPVVQSGTTKNVSVANLTAGRAVSAASLALTGTPLAVTSGGSGTSTAFTAGSVVFAGASGVYSQDNTNLFWDDTNNRLGLGTTAPVSTLELQGTTPVETISNNSNTSTSTGTVYSTLAMRSLKGGGAADFAYDDAWIQTQRSNYNYNSDFFTHDTKLVFFTNSSNRDGDPTARMSLDAQGLTLLNDGNLIQGTAAKGVNFTANTPAAGMTSQLLNWYEEGTWTPTVTANSGSITSYTSSGTYTRTGRQVTLLFTFTITNNGTGAGDIRITNLPFTTSADSLGNGCGRENATSGFMVNAIIGAANTIAVYKYDNNYPGGTGNSIKMMFTYFV